MAVYVCPVCGFHYARKEVALQCLAWCKTHKSCSAPITQHSLERKKV